MLMMDNLSARKPLKKYFYGGKSWLSIMFWAGIILLIPPATPLGMMVLPIWAVIKIVSVFMSASGDENLYDNILEQDIEYLKKRAVETMGLVEEEYSLIDPIVGFGYADESETVKKGAELEAEKKDFLQKIKDVIFSIPRSIFAFFRQFFEEKDFISRSIFFEGRDKKVRGSLVRVTMISFTEQQIVSYTCNYDIALGVILEEYVREVFYRDVDSVNYGDETLHIFMKDGRLLRTPVTWIRMAVSSGKDIIGSMTGETDLLENQIMAAKSLVRSKKAEMA